MSDEAEDYTIAIVDAEGVTKIRGVPAYPLDEFQDEIMKLFDDWARETKADSSARVLAFVGNEPISYSGLHRLLEASGYHVAVMEPRQQGKTARSYAYIEPDDATARDLLDALHVKEEPVRRQPDYLKHDPSKSHRRHGRRRRHERPFS